MQIMLLATLPVTEACLYTLPLAGDNYYRLKHHINGCKKTSPQIAFEKN
jgi:hypothetical protein